ncbi:hypothetical protein HKX48_003907 [Thoreauomyces humboldtii]|nr:hypothetical protein HKX48_003907 [Thoreauomyces humboldtii]
MVRVLKSPTKHQQHSRSPPANLDPASDIYNATTSPLTSDQIHLLVYQHLVHNCYQETARSFGTACNITSPVGSESASSSLPALPHNPDAMDTSSTPAGGLGGCPPPPTPLESLEHRNRIHELCLAGNIEEAVRYCNSVFPEALAGETPESVEMLFKLQCQRFVECVRVSAPEAMTFAQQELGKFGLFDGKYMDKLNEIIGLIAYPNPFHSPLKSYLADQHREEVATCFNSHILASQGFPPTTTIEQLIRQSTVVRESLHTVTEVPKDAKKNTQAQQPRWELSVLVGGESRLS